MPIRRLFCDWSQPALVATADYLVQTYGTAGKLDFQGVIVALPGNRACRRLLELLVQRADEKQLPLFPGQILTAGALPELLYEARFPFADDLTQTLAWVESLRSFTRDRLLPFTRRLPDSDDLPAWLSLGEMLSRLHRELAADAHDFRKVLNEAVQLPAFDEHGRWTLLAELQEEYLRQLDALKLWDKQTARLFAIEHRECRIDKDILLAGMADMNRAQRLMLDLVAERVTSLVFAPATLSDRFDGHGCLLPEEWHDVEIPLSHSQMELVDGPSDQADAVLRVLRDYGGRFAADEIAIGVPDEQLVPSISQRLTDWSIPVRYGVGQTLARSGPWLLLQGIATFLEERSRAAFAALLRHPALDDWIRRELRFPRDVDFLSALDRYFGERFPSRIAGDWIQSEQKEPRQLHHVFQRLDGPEGVWHELAGPDRPLGAWGPAIQQLYLRLFGGQPVDRDETEGRAVVKLAGELTRVLQSFAGIPARLQPEVSGPQALRLALRRCGTETLPAEFDPAAIELLGWLELPWDDAPALVVTGFNEGRVPSSRNADLFLPNEMRRLLHLEDNDRIYARDVYALSLLCASRRALHLIAGRRTAEGDPLIPSRLLFSCPLDELPARTLHFFPRQFDAEATTAESFARLQPGQKTDSEFQPPHPEEIRRRRPIEPPRSMRVTEFRDFIDCPYRYLLRHVLKLEALDDAVEELGGDRFGSLLHDVLSQFGNGPLRNSREAESIRLELVRLLDESSRQTLGEQPLPAIAVQLEHARRRLEDFSKWQANWAAAGWEILCTEANVPDQRVTFDVDGTPVFLRGRIDRIDLNPATGECFIFDYKTGDSAKPPQKTHRKEDDWIDLQLPLYRQLLRGIDQLADRLPSLENVRLGYIVLPKKADGVQQLVGEWTEDDLAAAEEKAREVVRAIRAFQFWPLTPSPTGFFDDLQRICGNAEMFEGLLAADAADSAEDEEDEG